MFIRLGKTRLININHIVQVRTEYKQGTAYTVIELSNGNEVTSSSTVEEVERLIKSTIDKQDTELRN